MEYIIARLSEPSTWRGIVWLITAFGVAIDPAQQEGIIAFGMALAGLVGVFTKEKKQPTEEDIEQLKEDIQARVETAVKKKTETGKKNAKPNKTDSDNFFND